MSFNSTFNNDQSIIFCPLFFLPFTLKRVEDTASHFCEGRFNICYIAVCYFTRIKICVFVLRKCSLPSPCWIARTHAPHSERRTWSGSTSTGSHSHLRTWSCGRCHRSARRRGERPSLPLPWPVGSQSLCSWITAAGYLCKNKIKQKHEDFCIFERRPRYKLPSQDTFRKRNVLIHLKERMCQMSPKLS